jgi:hypothetical protein
MLTAHRGILALLEDRRAGWVILLAALFDGRLRRGDGVCVFAALFAAIQIEWLVVTAGTL